MARPRPTPKTALVTGASSGMGKEIAKRLIADGLVVYVAARSVDKMADLVQLGAIPLKMDISRDEEIVAAVDTITAGHGGVDVLINNAGFGQYGPVEQVTLDAARYQFEVNLFGLARLTQLLTPAMRNRGAGKIVNISSMGGKIYTPLGAWYHASKHAVEGWSDCLRLELAPFGIDVIIIEPGIILTEFGTVVGQQMPEGTMDGPYGAVAQALAAATEKSYAKGQGSQPSLIAGVVSKALTARRPKTRYVAGAMARPLIALRHWLGDRAYDRIIMSQMK